MWRQNPFVKPLDAADLLVAPCSMEMVRPLHCFLQLPCARHTAGHVQDYVPLLTTVPLLTPLPCPAGVGCQDMPTQAALALTDGDQEVRK
jgi:hypothetical protein